MTNEQIEILTSSDENAAQFFTYAHLPEHLASVSRLFAELAANILLSIPKGRQRSVALEKLLESKDAAVRAMIQSRNRNGCES